MYTWKKNGLAKLAAAVAVCAMIGTMPVTSLAQEETKTTLPNGEEIYNVLLIGTDHRDESWNGNADVVMVATINADSEKIILTSFMRDLYADIPGYGVHKLNYAYAAGGPETLEATLEDNYQLEIDNYAVVDFETMADIVDIAGGVEITITDDECTVLNDYLTSMDAEEDFLPGGGTWQMNGNQAVAHMRDRFVGDNDYERTQRQREVLTKIFDSMRQLDAEKLTGLAEKVLPCIAHDIDAIRMVKLIAVLPKLAGYTLEENRIPYDGLYESQNEMLVPDFEATILRLHEMLYGN